MDKKTLMKYTGSLQQAAYVRPVRYTEGRAVMDAFQIKNGSLMFTVMADKCLDIGELSYKGINFNFLSKPGLNGRNPFDTAGSEAQRSIMGGLFFTAGLENICAPCTLGGHDYPMHGRMRTTPAEHLSGDAFWDGDSYILTVSGEMREAELFGENMLLRRKIETRYGEKSVTVHDEFENLSFRPEPMMLLYHCNVGFPLLDGNCRVFLPAKKVTPRDEAAACHMETWNKMEQPLDNEPERVYIFDLAADMYGNTMAAVLNMETYMGLKIEWNRKYLPYFMEWKSVASGDYVIGFEPANSSVYGRPYHTAHKCLHTLDPFCKETINLKFTAIDGKEECLETESKIEKLLKGDTEK